MTESPKQIPPFGLRLPPDLKERVQEAAQSSHQSMNSLILSVLEEAFPEPLIDMYAVAELLDSISHDAESGDGSYISQINDSLAGAKNPWEVMYGDGELIFRPLKNDQANPS